MDSQPAPNSTATPDATPQANIPQPDAPQWSHIEGLTLRDPYTDGIDPAEYHNLDADGTVQTKPCFMCWCYSCGGRTDQPRIRRNDDREGLDDPDSHRWCFE